MPKRSHRIYIYIYILESCGRPLGGLDSDQGPQPGPGHFSANARESERLAISSRRKQRRVGHLRTDFSLWTCFPQASHRHPVYVHCILTPAHDATSSPRVIVPDATHTYRPDGRNLPRQFGIAGLGHIGFHLPVYLPRTFLD